MADIHTEPVLFNETFYDQSFSHHCEGEVLLPEYLPDVSSIVRIDARPILLEAVCKKGEIELEGRVECIVLYLTAEGTIQSFYTRIPFDVSVEDERITAQSRVLAHLQMESVQCRPLSGRKLSIRCAVAFSLQAERTQERQLVSKAALAEKGCEVRVGREEVARFLEAAEEDFTLEEMLELPSDRSRMERILKCDIHADPTEKRVASGRVIVEGKLSVSCLYLSNVDTGETDQFTTNVSFQKVLELPQLKEGDLVCVEFLVLENACGILEDTAGEERILSCKVKVRIKASAYRNQLLEVVLDAYAKDNELTLQGRELQAEVVRCSACTGFSLRESFRPKEAIARIYSAEGYADLQEFVVENRRLHLHGELLVSFLVLLEEGETVGLDQIFAFNIPCEEIEVFKEGKFFGDCGLESFSYQMRADGSIEVETKLCCQVFGKLCHSFAAVEGMEYSPSSAKEQGKCLTLYYPSGGESLWEIGKRYAAPVESIRMANKIEGDSVPEGVAMLLIPRW